MLSLSLPPKVDKKKTIYNSNKSLQHHNSLIGMNEQTLFVTQFKNVA